MRISCVAFIHRGFVHCRLGGNSIGEEGAEQLIVGIKENLQKEVWYVMKSVLLTGITM